MFRFGIPFIISCLLKCTLVLNTDSNTTCLDFYKMKGESMKTKSCTGEFIVSHCIPNVEHQEVDVCVQWKWITPGICSSKYAENASCKTTCRDDFKSYDYVFCEQEVLSTVTGSVPTTLSTTQKSVTYDKDNKTEVNEERDTDFGSALGIAFGVLITIILMVAAAVLLIKYGKMLENCGKGSEENMADIEAHPDEVRKPFLNEEEEKKKDEENERNDDGKTKILDEIREREWSSTQNTVEKAESESTETDENQSNEAGNKDKDVKLHALDNREESLIPKHVISTTSNQTPKSDINQEDSGNLQDDNKMSVCSTGGFEKEGGNSSEHKSDEKGRRNVTNAEDTGGSVDSFENNHGNENTVDPSNRLTEGSVDQDGNLDACKPIPDSIVETG
ncbi:uncharacterized protein LOC134232147 isoform X2 [Saccostrea cucullata]|uniref:uncharacterized protein LOC134232147 isoform X2 n=1 Tax=Saccostrea cuccullata TaxID=36930 RepID=UPI002ED5579C